MDDSKKSNIPLGSLPFISKILSGVLGGESAEAKQFFASKSGEVPKDIPLNFKKKSLGDVLGKEPQSGKEYKELLNQEFLRRVEENKKISDPKQRKSTGKILNELDNDLLEASLHKVGVKNLQDVPEKFLSALDLSKEDIDKFNQIYLQPEGKPGKKINIEGFAFPTIPKKDAKPLGTGVEAIKYKPKETSSVYDFKTWGLPVETKGELEAKKVWPLAKTTYYPEYPEESAKTMAHELLHNLAQYKYPSAPTTIEEDYSQHLKDVDLSEAQEQLGFMQHFIPSKIAGERTTGLQGRVANIFHPEWFNPNIKASPTPSPTPTPTPRPSPTPYPDEILPEPESLSPTSQIYFRRIKNKLV